MGKELSVTEKAGIIDVEIGMRAFDLFSEKCKELIKLNEALLMRIIESNKGTEYGRKYHFDQIRPIE